MHAEVGQHGRDGGTTPRRAAPGLAGADRDAHAGADRDADSDAGAVSVAKTG